MGGVGPISCLIEADITAATGSPPAPSSPRSGWMIPPPRAWAASPMDADF